MKISSPRDPKKSMYVRMTTPLPDSSLILLYTAALLRSCGTRERLCARRTIFSIHHLCIEEDVELRIGQEVAVYLAGKHKIVIEAADYPNRTRMFPNLASACQNHGSGASES